VGGESIVVEKLRRKAAVAERVAAAVGAGTHGEKRHPSFRRDAGDGGALHVFHVAGDDPLRPHETLGRRQRRQLASVDLPPTRRARERSALEGIDAHQMPAEHDHRLEEQADGLRGGRSRRHERAALEGFGQRRAGAPSERQQRCVRLEHGVAAGLRHVGCEHDVADVMLVRPCRSSPLRRRRGAARPGHGRR
jgi:hypothetical protein